MSTQTLQVKLSARSTYSGRRLIHGSAAATPAPCRFTVVDRATKDRISFTPETMPKWFRSSDVGLYPEKTFMAVCEDWGEFPKAQSGYSPVKQLTYEQYQKNVEREVIHGRFAMLGITGVWVQELFGQGPWFLAGRLECDPVSSKLCELSYGGTPFGGEPTSFGGLVLIQAIIMTFVEGYRTGLLPVPDSLPMSNTKDTKFATKMPEYDTVYPGGAFDPFQISERGLPSLFGLNREDLSVLKIKELKHGRLAMLAFLGVTAQAFATNTVQPFEGGTFNGALDNWASHVSNPGACNVVDHTGCGLNPFQ